MFYRTVSAPAFYECAMRKFPKGLAHPFRANPGDIVGGYTYISDEGQNIVGSVSRKYFIMNEERDFDIVSYKNLSAEHEPIAAMLSMRMSSAGVEHTKDFYKMVDDIRAYLNPSLDAVLQYRLALFPGFSFVSAIDDSNLTLTGRQISEDKMWELFEPSHYLIVDTPVTAHDKIAAIKAMKSETIARLIRTVIGVHEPAVSKLNIRIPDINFTA